jgi:[ribosomal protein S5]-alanine N-acetyltransferase
VETPHPTLRTGRLVLRAFALEDAPSVQKLSGAREIARTTRPIPHPYPDGEAERWISTHRASFDSGEAVHFAVELLETRELVGGVTLAISRGDDRAHLTYWVGVPYWGRGYATEAAREAIRHAFEDLKLNRVHAAHFGSNPASGRVMQKVGMTREGVMREHHKKWGEYEDRGAYGLLATDWERVERQPRPPRAQNHSPAQTTRRRGRGACRAPTSAQALCSSDP